VMAGAGDGADRRAIGSAGVAGGGVPPQGPNASARMRRTVSAIVSRHRNGATRRAIPAELGPWWTAAQLFIRWAKLGVWKRLLDLAQAGGVRLGMAFPDSRGF